MLQPGSPAPLGATLVTAPDQAGVNFAVWSGAASRAELCLFDGSAETRLELHRTGDIWHGFLPGAAAGLRYGFRLHGEFDPARGRRFNPAKLLIDPYARSLSGPLVSDRRLYDYDPDAAGWTPDNLDSAPVVPKSVVVDDAFDWHDTDHPRTALEDSVVYELHVKGFTRQHPAVPRDRRGTYLGLAEPAVIEYLQGLGVTAVELLPCASFVTETLLAERGLTNYWGYNPIAFFAPHAGYAQADAGREFKTMVRALHAAGIEVILDVVYNHTAEGDARGPTYSFRGLDNETYYLLRQHDRSAYVNNSGCGNSLASNRPPVLKLVLDSLRYWVEVMHVDGFRFDLGPSMARVDGEYHSAAPFFQALYQDPVLCHAKLIAEPWDVGHAGYRLGQFPPGWSEWNDRYRATVRAFWRGDSGVIGEFASRLSGSSDIFGSRGPTASINYVTAHDGFTLSDLVSYEQRHNLANGENNADGDRHNLSWNHGVEGESTDPGILRRRNRDKRALLATLLFSQGVPMLQAGDEMGRSQGGNNNAYCQDNETSWLDWEQADTDLVAFVRRLIGLRAGLGVLRRREFLRGLLHEASALHDVQWLSHSGDPMELEQWRDDEHRSLAVLLYGDLDHADLAPQARQDGDDALILINASAAPVDFSLPTDAGSWRCELDSDTGVPLGTRGYRAAAKSVVLLVRSRT